MKIIENVGADRLVDVLQSAIPRSRSSDVAVADLSIYAVADLLLAGTLLFMLSMCNCLRAFSISLLLDDVK